MIINQTSMYSMSQAMVNSYSQPAASSRSTNPVERLEQASGMNEPAMREMLAPERDSTANQQSTVTFNAQAELDQFRPAMSGSNIDISV